jgi:hypothetical protein
MNATSGNIKHKAQKLKSASAFNAPSPRTVSNNKKNKQTELSPECECEVHVALWPVTDRYNARLLRVDLALIVLS